MNPHLYIFDVGNHHRVGPALVGQLMDIYGLSGKEAVTLYKEVRYDSNMEEE